MGFLDTARQHFNAMRGKTLEVPEWGLVGDDALHFDPPTLGERQAITSRAGKSQARQFALALIVCGKNKDGAPLFEDNADTLAFLQSEVDPKVVVRIFNAIMDGGPTEGDLGNS